MFARIKYILQNSVTKTRNEFVVFYFFVIASSCTVDVLVQCTSYLVIVFEYTALFAKTYMQNDFIRLKRKVMHLLLGTINSLLGNLGVVYVAHFLLAGNSTLIYLVFVMW